MPTPEWQSFFKEKNVSLMTPEMTRENSESRINIEKGNEDA
jgi:hypothetical protein